MDIDTPENDENLAVIFRNVSKSFEKGKISVLKNFSMSVRKGSVYGLLGASGSGKTTLLNIAVGLQKFRGGEVQVLGGTPGNKNSGVPGPRVGFMPQDSALVAQFTVAGALYYFGWLYGMNSKEIEEQIEFLSELLQLPPRSQMVDTLSGGQQRRLSFAATLIHSPELLILDEPTVGLDPVLRQTIWDYLLKLSVEQGVTVLFTTHYIEEAKESQKIGLLRNGILLAETSPNFLLSKYGFDTLEEVFLHLSQIQSGQSEHLADKADQVQSPKPGTSSDPDVPQDSETSSQLQEVDINTTKKPVHVRHRSFWARMKSLLYKNVLKTFRNKGGVIFNFVYSLVFLFTFFVSMGKDPVNLPVAVVNEELGNCYDLPGGISKYSGVELMKEEGEDDEDALCIFRGMSCLYLKGLEGNTDIRYYDTLEDGLKATEKGVTFSTLLFHKNFTESLQERYDDPFAAHNATLDYADVMIWMDMAEYTIGYTLKKSFQDKMVDLYKYIARTCNETESVSGLPIKFEDPVYGKKDITFAVFMTPGMMMSLMYLLAVIMTSNEIVTERCDGLWNRNLVAGVTEFEIILAHLVAQLFTLILQLAETFIFAIYVFNVEILGSVFGSLVLVLLQSLCGASMGLLISVANKSVTQAMFMSMGSFYPYMILCGNVWPIEGMIPWLQTVSYLTPGTWTITALRNIFVRGWPVTHPQVYPGYVTSIVWVFIFTSLSIVGLKLSRH